MRRRAAIALIATTGAAVIAAAVVAPYVIAERGWQAAATRIEAAIGSRLSAAGPIQGRLWPAPRLIIAGLEATAPGDPTGVPLVYADHAKVDIGWSALLSGRLDSAKIHLRSVRVLALPLHPPADVQGGFDASGASFTASFEDGTARATLRPEPGGLRLEELEFRVGPLAAAGAGRVAFGEGTRLVLTLDRLRWSDMDLGRADVAVSGERDGILIERAALSGPDGREAAAFGLATTVGGDLRFLGGVDVQSFLGSEKVTAAARLTARLGREAQRLEVDDIDIRLGAAHVTGRARLDSAATPQLAAELRADRIDLAALDKASAVALTPLLATASSELRLRLGQLAWGDAAAQGVVIDIARRAEDFDLKELAIRDIGGASLHVAGRFRRAADGILASDALAFRYGQVDGKGRLAVDPGASPIRVTADIQTGPLVLDAIVPPLPALPAEPMTRRAMIAARQAPPPPRAGWSRERLSWPGLPPVHADVKLRAPLLGWRDLRLETAQFAGRLADGILVVDELSGLAYGGRVVIRGRTPEAGGAPAGFAGTLQAADMDLKALLAASGIDEISGRVNGTAELSATGASPAELIAGLAGKLRLECRDGVVNGFDLPAMSARLKQMQRPTDLFEVLRLGSGGGRTPFRALTGTFRIDRGVARTDDLRLVAAAGEGRTRGTVDLPAWSVDLLNEFRLSEHPDLPPLGLKLSGPIQAPRRVFDIERLQSSLARRGRTPAR